MAGKTKDKNNSSPNERELATREILQAISNSRHDEKPVFDVILRNAARLCSASHADLDLIDETGTTLSEVATWGPKPRQKGSEFWTWSLDDDFEFVVATREGRIAHNADIRDSEHYRNANPTTKAAADEEGLRTFLSVPLLSQGKSIGCLILFRTEVAPFTDDEIDLVRSFADQAVIAIENTRQFKELQDRLERESATAEILEIISRSRDDAQPAFDAILSKACELCETQSAGMFTGTPDDKVLNFVAVAGSNKEIGKALRSSTTPMDPDYGYSPRAVVKGKLYHFEDMAESELYKSGSEFVRRNVDDFGIRSVIFCPLMGQSGPVGVIAMFREEVRPFTDAQVKLIESFAAQAAIAIENVKQFREVQERLEREAATGEVLSAISQNQDNELPVFDVILRKAADLCNAQAAGLVLGKKGDSHQRMPASYGTDPATIAVYDDGKVPMDPDISLAAKAILNGEVVHIEDMAETDGYRRGLASHVTVVNDSGIRTNLFVPLMTPIGGIGALILFRKEVRPYTEDEISVVETFAAQAVIAIKNVRQFRALQNRLEREAATKNILEVISRSRTDEQPVFEKILESAARLCGAPLAGLNIADESRSHQTMVAHWGEELKHLVAGETVWSLDSELSLAVAFRENRVVHVDDLADTDLYRQGDPVRVGAVEEEGIRTFLAVPLVLHSQAIGTIALYRREVRNFTDDEIELVKTFAEQAIIAIENVRQFREVQERLEREAATKDILHVISQSRDDEGPVFDVILDNASRLCESPLTFLLLRNEEDQRVHPVATRGLSKRWLDRFTEGIAADSPLIAVRAISEQKVFHVPDLASDELYHAGDDDRRVAVHEEGIRTLLAVPVLQNGQAIGSLCLFRKEIKPYDSAQIALVEAFAAQAAIAIENVRQFKALEALNAELGDRVEEQVGEIERMGLLKRFLPAAVADTVVSQGSDKMLTSHRALLGVLFCDIRGFTAFCESAEPEETIEVLQTYHQELGKLINDHGAGVDHRMGDGIMVLFNDPLPCEDPAGDAVRLAIAMRAKMVELCKGWKRLGHRLGFGVGVSLGYATVGMVGYEGRSDYTASGTAVNLAARLCDQAEDGEILLSPRAAIAVEGDHACEPRGEVHLKGIRDPVEVFRLVGDSG